MTDPKVVEDVQRTQFENFAKGEYGTAVMRDFMGQGIFSVDGPDWVRQRKTASNLFTMRALRDSMAVTIGKHARVLLRVLGQASRQQQSVDLFQIINQFTMEAFSELAFGIHMNGLETGEEHPFHHAFDTALAALGHRLMKPVWFWKLQRALAMGQEGVLIRNMKIIHDTVLEFIAQTLTMRNSKTSRDTPDIVSLFQDHASYTPATAEEEFDPIMLRDIVVNFMVAGKDTTAEALSWFFVSLRDHPEVERKIREEILAKLPDLAKPNTTASMEDVQQLVYLEAALKETLRLFPSVPFNAREALSDTVLVDGTFVPKGTMLSFPAYAMGRMESVWGKDVEQFKPERFIDPATGKLTNASAYQFNAFYGGPRMCLGVTLAMMEMKIVVASLLPKFHLQLASEKTVTYDISITLPVKDPLLVRAASGACFEGIGPAEWH